METLDHLTDHMSCDQPHDHKEDPHDVGEQVIRSPDDYVSVTWPQEGAPDAGLVLCGSTQYTNDGYDWIDQEEVGACIIWNGLIPQVEA